MKVHKYLCVSSDAIHVHMPRLCSSLSNNLFLGIRFFKIKSYAILNQTTKKVSIDFIKFLNHVPYYTYIQHWKKISIISKPI